MKTITVEQYDAFSIQPNKGNPAGVVLNADGLTNEEMQEIALQVGFNETAFALTSSKADYLIKYFTPGHETKLCGHATVAMIYALHHTGELKGKQSLTIETGAGVLPITIDASEKDGPLIKMEQAPPRFADFNGSPQALVDCLGIEVEDLHDEWPIQYGNTGVWTLLVPVKTLDAIKRMEPRNKCFSSVLNEWPHASIHPFCLETFDPKAEMHGRHFSSPDSGTTEDPVTGTASGVMGAYYVKNICREPTSQIIIIEQGQEIGKDGRVSVEVKKISGGYNVRISGTAVYVKTSNVMSD